jgi:hypothetical protein
MKIAALSGIWMMRRTCTHMSHLSRTAADTSDHEGDGVARGGRVGGGL